MARHYVEDDYFRRRDLERLRILIRRQFDHLAIAADMKRKSEASVLFNHPFDRFMKCQFGTLLQRQAENSVTTSRLWCQSALSASDSCHGLLNGACCLF